MNRKRLGAALLSAGLLSSVSGCAEQGSKYADVTILEEDASAEVSLEDVMNDESWSGDVSNQNDINQESETEDVGDSDSYGSRDPGATDVSPDSGTDAEPNGNNGGEDASSDVVDGGEPDSFSEPDIVEETEPEGDPGTVVLHRLNRVEYDNTVQDLLGTSQSFADQFPADDTGYGFDNIASVLSMSSLHLELYELAARSVIEEAILLEPFLDIPVYFQEAETGGVANVGVATGVAWNLYSVGTHTTTFDIQDSGTYRVQGRLWHSPGGDELAKGSLSVDEVSLLDYAIGAVDADTGEIIEVFVELEPGEHTFSFSFINDYYEPDTKIDRNLYLDWVEVSGPQEWLEQTLPNPLREDLLVCEPSEQGETEACARENLEAFLPRAWRRPVESTETDFMMNLFSAAVADGAGFDEALTVPFIASLMSPHFLFRVEMDEDLSNPTPHLLSDHELATRLSYFLWSSTPDAQLLEKADAGLLQDKEILIEETLRMLADPKAHALIDNYAGQWLYLRGLWDAFPAQWIFPDWSEELRASMAAEAWLFVETFIKGDRPMTELLTSTTSFVDQRLAEHYDMDLGPLIPGVFAEVDVSGVERGGILRQGGLLTTLSFPTRTSPVKRGKWVLGQLLCFEPPPPPPGVEGLLDQEGTEDLSLAEKLALHSADPACSSCHMLMDPIGLGLENFDGIGAFRLMDGDTVIDPSGSLPGGTDFADAGELMNVLAENPDFIGCMAEKMMTYALGRGLTAADEPYQDWIVHQFEAGGLSFKELVIAVVTSSPFRKRRPELTEGGTD